jgi:vancomycin resistance protein VanW
MRTPLALLPRPIKRRIRICLRILIARLRWYPLFPKSQLLTDLEAARRVNSKYVWHKAITPVPSRGDEQTRTNRVHNLEKAIGSLNNLLIRPNQTISLAGLIGEPTVSKGYREGPVFVNGVVSSDFGGGLCLIATNLYQLFVYSGFKIVERHGHSIDAYGGERFYALGEDAAMSYAVKDLVVKNVFPVPLLLQIKISGETLESCLYGNKQNTLAVRVHSIVLDKVSPGSHQEHAGWDVCTMRFVRRRNSSRWFNDYTAFTSYAPS